MKKWFVIAAALLIAGIGVAVKLRGSARSEFETLTVPQQNLAMYDAFWAAVDANYYDPKLLETASMRDLRTQWRAKAEAADAIRIYWDVLQPLAAKFPHSHVEVRPNFTQEDLLKAAFPKGNAEVKKAFAAGPGYEGITIRRPDGTHWIVGDVIAGSPAEKAGITPGWKVLRGINSLNVSNDGKTMVARFAGEFVPPGEDAAPISITFDLVPRLERSPFDVKRLEGGVTYVRFDLFGQVGEPEKVIAAIDSAGPAGLVLDLRKNIGGISEDCSRIGGRVLGDGVSMGTMRGRAGTADRRAVAPRQYKGPLVILIGPASASAAEILAAAVQDHARGKLIGRATNGSVLSARFFPLPGGGSVMVPEQDFLRVDGRRIEGIGVEPDIAVMPTLEDVRAGRDPALERALAELRNGSGPAAGPAPTT